MWLRGRHSVLYGWCAGRNPSLALVISVFVVCLLLEIGGVIFVSLCIVRFAILLSVMYYVQRCFLLLQVACLYAGSSLGLAFLSGLKIRHVFFCFRVRFLFALFISVVWFCLL